MFDVLFIALMYCFFYLESLFLIFDYFIKYKNRPVYKQHTLELIYPSLFFSTILAVLFTLILILVFACQK